MIEHPIAKGEKGRLSHIAFIMDGNGRWAERQGKPREFGHIEGARVFHDIAVYCFENGIDAVTAYAFSTENWKRPKHEVDAIMKLFDSYLKTSLQELIEKGVSVRFLGDKALFANSLRRQMEMYEEKSKGNPRFLNIAMNYGGRADIVNAVNRLISAGETEMTEEKIDGALYTHDIPDPDLIVRTAGEYRLSNFLTWQSTYSELYFTDVLWPDMSGNDVDLAAENYYHRQRRFGGV